MSEDINKINDKEEEIFPDHVPVVPFDVQKEREKEEQRKLAKELRKKSGSVEAIIITKSNGVKRASELNYEEQEDEIIRCASNPIYFIETYLTIFDQTQGKSGLIVSFKLFEYQK